jgi:hypothetical protein
MFRVWVVLLFLVASVPSFAANEAIFSGQTGQLQIPKVVLEGDENGQAYSVDLNHQGGVTFDVSGIAVAPAKVPVRLSIHGGHLVAKNGQLELSAFAHFDDGSWEDVTTDAVWEEKSPLITSIIQGRVRAANVLADENTIVRAFYSIGSSAVSVEHGITLTANKISRLSLELINADSFDSGKGPLIDQPNDGFFINLGGSVHEISSSQIHDATTYMEYLLAVEREIFAIGLSEVIKVSMGEQFTDARPDTFALVSGTTIVLECSSPETISGAGFANVSYDPSVTFIARMY